MTVRKVPDDYPTIQAAVNASSPGDTIKVEEGIYNESVVVPPTKSRLRIEGEGPGESILRGPGTTGSGFILNGTNGVEIADFSVLDFPDEAILVNGGSNNMIDHVTIRNASRGIWFTNTAFTCVVQNCKVSRTVLAIVVGPGTEHAFIAENRVYDNFAGAVAFNNSHRVQVVKNHFLNNVYGAASASSWQTFIEKNRFTANLVAASIERAADFNRCIDNHFEDNIFGVHVFFSSFAQVLHNNMKAGVSSAVLVVGSNSNQVMENEIKGRWNTGVSLANANDNTVARNELKGNANGILLAGSSTGNVVRDNEIKNSAMLDINDTSGGVNTFDENECRLSFPSGLCERC